MTLKQDVVTLRSTITELEKGKSEAEGQVKLLTGILEQKENRIESLMEKLAELKSELKQWEKKGRE